MSQDMLKSLLSNNLFSLGEVALNTIIIYLFLIILMSKVSKRQRSEIAYSELLVVALLGSAVETALIAGNKSLAAGLVSAGTLLITNRLLAILTRRWAWLRQLIVGKPILLACQGKLLPDPLRQVGLDEDDILEGIRSRGFERIEQTRLIILEVDGSISVIPKDEKDKK